MCRCIGFLTITINYFASADFVSFQTQHRNCQQTFVDHKSRVVVRCNRFRVCRYRLSLGTAVTTLPTIGSNVEVVNHGNLKFNGPHHFSKTERGKFWDLIWFFGICVDVLFNTSRKNLEVSQTRNVVKHLYFVRMIFFSCGHAVWDVGGQEVLRASWSQYFDDVDVLIFVVDRWKSKNINWKYKLLNCLRQIIFIVEICSRRAQQRPRPRPDPHFQAGDVQLFEQRGAAAGRAAGFGE